MWPYRKKELTLEEYKKLIVHVDRNEDYSMGCEWLRSLRWSRYFNGWTTWDSDDVNNALYPTRDETCWKYAGKKL